MKKILVIFGGSSNEHNISCLSAFSILKNINYKKYDVYKLGISKDNIWLEFKDNIDMLKDGSWINSRNNNKIENIINYLKSFDIVFPVLHGKNGEDGKIQGLLDIFNIKYVGCKTLSSAIGMDKLTAKMIFSYLNVPLVPYVSFLYPNYNIKHIEKNISYPLIVKPANSGSSIGISKVHNRKELIKSLKNASIHDTKIIIEKFIEARELECSILEGKKMHISSIGEIKSSNNFYDFNAKYENSNSKVIIPAVIPKNIETKIKEYSKMIFNALDCSGLSRIDFFYDEKENNIYINEINTMPGFTEISMFPSLFIYDKISYQKIISMIIENC